jgi:alanine-synthesizing transaminase
MFSDRTNWKLAANRLSEALAKSPKIGGQPVLDLTASNPTTCGFKYHAGATLRALSESKCSAGLRSRSSRACSSPAARCLTITRPIKFASPVDEHNSSPPAPARPTLLCSERSAIPGDEVLIPEPSYPLFAFLAEIQDVKLSSLSVDLRSRLADGFPFALEGAMTNRTRAVIVVHPNNPTGHFTKTG